MRIGILTLPLSNNYGSIIQAFALQKILKELGHDALTVDFSYQPTWILYLKIITKNLIDKYVLRKNIKHLLPVFPNKKEKTTIEKHIANFILENIQTTETLSSTKQINKLKKYQFEAFVVGSDQVWRPKYSPDLRTFFLDFVEDNKKTKRIAYAPSFGVADWEFTPSLTEKCKKLVQRFDAISVREDSGVKLCKDHLGVDAIHLLDPTFLVDKDEYLTLIENDKPPENKNILTLYILDQTPEKLEIINKIQQHLTLEINSVMPQRKFSTYTDKDIDQCVFPPITKWLSSFRDAQFVITDSFHGTVFSIIFNKPFLSIGNKSRGLARFTSLLKLFGLENRLIFNVEDLTSELMSCSIDYDTINKSLLDHKKKSILFLKSALES